MKLAETIMETVNSKYITNKYPIINGITISQYRDYIMPAWLCSDTGYNVDYDLFLSPNTKNFVQYQDIFKNQSFNEFMDLASNKYIPDFERIKNNEHKLSIIGYGGFMSNMIYFIDMINLSENKVQDILNIKIYENDNFSLMNAVRTFQDISTFEDNDNTKSKLILASKLQTIYYIETVNRKFTQHDILLHNENKLFIGSPDLETRQLLENENFIFFGNSNADFIIHKTPIVDADMARETYGKLNVIEFWVGILEATYEFLKLLENNTSEDLKHLADNTEIWSTNIQKGKSNV